MFAFPDAGPIIRPFVAFSELTLSGKPARAASAARAQYRD